MTAVAILHETETVDLMTVTIAAQEEKTFRQEAAGRPGPDTRYRAGTRPRFRLTYAISAPAVQAEAAADGWRLPPMGAGTLAPPTMWRSLCTTWRRIPTS